MAGRDDLRSKVQLRLAPAGDKNAVSDRGRTTEEVTLTRGVSNMFARVALLSAIGMVLALAVAPVPVRAAGHGHQNEVNFQAYTAECAKMDPNSQAYKDCMNLAEGQ
jgi:hypothetical protein